MEEGCDAHSIEALSAGVSTTLALRVYTIKDADGYVYRNRSGGQGFIFVKPSLL